MQKEAFVAKAAESVNGLIENQDVEQEEEKQKEQSEEQPEEQSDEKKKAASSGDLNENKKYELCPIEYRESVIDRMKSLEVNAQETYASRENHSLQQAYIVQNLYGNAPLTAIAMFETTNPCDVQVLVKGKTPEMNIQYQVKENATEHKIGIFGLYAGYENQVVITAGEESCEFSIITPELPENMTSVYRNAVDAQEEELYGQMILISDGWYTIFDSKGDIRWYLDKKYHTTSVSGAFAIDHEKNGIWFTYGTTNGSPYRDGAQLFHMDWMGKIEGTYSYDGYCFHHAIDLLPDGDILFPGTHDYGENKFVKLDPKTGKIETILDLNEVDWLDPSVGNINPRSKEVEDWAHPNSIQYVEERNCLLISLRNQHMLINVDYETKKPNWVLTPAYSMDEKGKITAWQEKAIPYMIIPEESFEWFYTQHDLSYICGDEDSMEFTIFDNGSLRYAGHGIQEELDDGQRYSRMVRIRVDEKKHKVETLFEYGKKEGNYLYSRTFGNTQYIAENGHYLGCFVCKNDIYPDVSKIIEVDENAKLVSCYSIGKVKEGCYRAQAVWYHEFDFSTNMEKDGIEIHRYQEEQWQSISLPEQTVKYENLHVSEIYRDDNTISTYGKAFVNKNYKVDQIWLALIAENGKAYGFPMVSAQRRGGGYYGVGIPLTGIPEGTYRIAVITYGTDGTAAYTMIRDVLTE